MLVSYLFEVLDESTVRETNFREACHSPHESKMCETDTVAKQLLTVKPFVHVVYVVHVHVHEALVVCAAVHETLNLCIITIIIFGFRLCKLRLPQYLKLPIQIIV